jgi:hypothetical protein
VTGKFLLEILSDRSQGVLSLKNTYHLQLHVRSPYVFQLTGLSYVANGLGRFYREVREVARFSHRFLTGYCKSKWWVL